MSGNHEESSARVIGLVAKREINQRLRSKSFLILTGVLVVLIVGIGVISRLAGDDGPSTIDVTVTAPAPQGIDQALDEVATQYGLEVDLRMVDDEPAARKLVEDGDADLAVISAEGRLLAESDVSGEANAVVQQAWAAVSLRGALDDAGLDAEQIDAALGSGALEPVLVGEDDSEQTGLAILTGTLAAILLFISLQTFGGYVLVGVVEEKATAVVEVLLARVRPDQLLAGKVIGIGVAALTQFAAAVAAGLVSLAISGRDIPSEIWSTLPITVLWFLGGYALYSTLFAVAGSLVSRQEDAQAASAPILTAMIAGYMLVFIFGYVPESTASRIMSLIPPIAPFLMPMRMAAGAASVVEIVVSFALLLGSVLLAWKLAGRIYEQVLLRRGSRISWGDALAILRRG